MKFVFFGVLGMLFAAAASYLYFVPFYKVANDTVVTVREVSEELGSMLGVTRPRLRNPEPEADDDTVPTRQPVSSSVDSRAPIAPRARTPQAPQPTGSAAAAINPAAAAPQPTLSVKTIKRDALSEVQVYVHEDGAKTVTRLENGAVVASSELPE